MSRLKPLDDSIHDLFASYHTERDSASSVDGDDTQADVYEQLAQLEYIYVDELNDDNEDQDDLEKASLRVPVSIADFIEGVTQLATMGVVEVTDIVEAMHREIMLRPIGRFNDRHLTNWQRGITGRIYGTVRQVMVMVGSTLATGVRLSKKVLKSQNSQPLPERMKQLVNVINGVMGDHLVKHHNSLAIPMVLYGRYGHLQHKELSGRVTILCHGLCMSHLSWNPSKSNSLGEQIISALPDTNVLYLDYNTGRRISNNGRNFSRVLQDLVENNPNITQIDLVGHSMGGLVSRSALFYGKQQGFTWVKQVGNLITLGSPHHGALLERIGFFVQDIIAKLPFAGSLAKLGDLRSAGIIDLRHGSIREEDWKSLEGRSVLPPEFRHPARLPSHVHTYFIAGTLAEAHFESKASMLLGDGLVTIESALGEHPGEHELFVPEGRKAIFYGVSHYELLYSDRVYEQVVTWLVENGRTDNALNSRIYSYPEDIEVAI